MKNNRKERDEKEGKWGKLLALPPLAPGPCYAPVLGSMVRASALSSEVLGSSPIWPSHTKTVTMVPTAFLSGAWE